MPILPVWCEGWALGCCNPAVATVGSSWRPTLVAHIVDPDPTDAPLGWSAIDGDRTSIVGEVTVDRAVSRQPVIDAGSIRIAVKTAGRMPEGRFRTTTTVYFDWHADIDPALEDLVRVEGVVTDVLLYEPIYEPSEEDPRMHRFVRWQDPVAVGSTAGWHGIADAVVRLDVGPLRP